MSSYAPRYAVGEEGKLPVVPAKIRRPTHGVTPPPAPLRHGWQGAKPPPSLLRDDIERKREEALRLATFDFEDDEDYLRGNALERRHKRDSKALEGLATVGDIDESDEDDDEDDDESAEPLPPQVKLPSVPFYPPTVTASSSSSSSSSATSFADLMDGAVRAAFRSGIAQGRREQLPHPPCRVCAVRKERNRVAAKESRYKKRREAEEASTSRIIHAAADHAAHIAQAVAVPAPPPPATEEDETEPVPPPF